MLELASDDLLAGDAQLQVDFVQVLLVVAEHALDLLVDPLVLVVHLHQTRAQFYYSVFIVGELLRAQVVPFVLSL